MGWSIFQGMQGKTWAHKPYLELRLGKFKLRNKLAKIDEVVEEVGVRIESCLNVESIVSPFVENLEVDTQFEKDTTITVREEIPIEIDRE